MKTRGIFLLITVFLALSGSMIAQLGFAVEKDCCKKNSHPEECSNSKPGDKKNCNKDYCNPFQSCSTTPILVAQNMKLAELFFNSVKIYPGFKSYLINGFYSEPWQPPKA